MAMVVQHNLTAMNANRSLGVTTGQQAKSAEKLSSGYKINRAGDDAAGLKISEKMRSQIRGLNKASSNAQDGISLIQTAEGALGEAHSILQRMNELAVQGANDTNVTVDRTAINEELDALTAELDRIASTTQFNKQNLLDGNFTSKNLQVGANSDQKITISINHMNASALGLRSFAGTTSQAQTGQEFKSFTFGAYTVNYDANDDWATNVTNATNSIKALASKAVTTKAYVKQIDGTSVCYKDARGSKHATAQDALDADKTAFESALACAFTTSKAEKYADKKTVNALENAYAQVKTETEPNVDSYASANASIDAIQRAINTVSSQRSALGALQNRLEHTVANLDNVAENTQSSESRIRDTDMASEMVTYSKNNILAQAGQSMLAQANQSNQGVLSLLG